jgi:O-antigen ligase
MAQALVLPERGLALAGVIALGAALVPVFMGGRATLLLAAAGGLAAVLAVVRNPHWGVLTIAAMWFIEIDPVGVRYLSLPYLVSGVLLLPLALAILRERGVSVLKAPPLRLLLAILAAFLISTWWAEIHQPVAALPELDETTRLLQILVSRFAFLVFFVYFITTRGRLEAMVWLFVALITVAALSGLVPFLAGEGGRRAKAAFSLADNSNRLGFIALFALSLVWFHRAEGERRTLKLLSLPLLIVLPVTALATASRSALLQLVLFVCLVVADQHRWSPARRLQFVVLLVVVALAGMTVVSSTQLLRATTFETAGAAPGGVSLQNRVNHVKAAVDVTLANPVLGIGIGNFPWVHRAFYGLGAKPHNSYLWALTGGGVIALSLYLALFAVTYRMLRRLERAGPVDLRWLAKATRVNLLLFLLFSAFADFWHSDFLYLIVGFTVAMTALWHRRLHRAATPLRPVLAH